MKKDMLLLLFVSLAIALAPNAGAEEVGSQPGPTVQGPSNGIDSAKRSKLKERVSGRWAAMIKKDFSEAYEYFSPAYRKLFPLESYLRKTGPNVDWITAKILNISMNGDRADVKVHLDYRLNLPPDAGMGDVGIIGHDLDEVWLWKDENWWYVQQESRLSGA
jgi:hypothetical protein